MFKKLKELLLPASVTAGVTMGFQSIFSGRAKKQKQAEVIKAFEQLREENKLSLEKSTETNALLADIKILLAENKSLNKSEIEELFKNLKNLNESNSPNTVDNLASTSKYVAKSANEPDLYTLLENYFNTDSFEFYNYAGLSVIFCTCSLFMCISTFIVNNYFIDKLKNIQLDNNKWYYRLVLPVYNYYKFSIKVENYVLLLAMLILILCLLTIGFYLFTY